MTTFVPTSTLQTMPRIALNAPPHLPEGGNIETVAITTNAGATFRRLDFVGKIF